MESEVGKLFIGGISWNTDEDRLRDYFTNYGEVIEAVIMRDRTTGRARGFGFIIFADPSVAERVILEKHMIDGRNVEAKKAVPKDDHQILRRNTGSIHGSPGPTGRTKKIFVGGLASNVTEGEFKTYFDQFGTIIDVVVMYDHNTQRPRGFGFITFDSEEAVDHVLHKTFHELNGKMVEVKRAVPKELSPGPARSPLVGFNYGLSSRASSLLNMSPFGGRLSPIGNSRTGFSPFGSGSYGMGPSLDMGLSLSYGRNPNFGNSQGYAQLLSPNYYSGNFNSNRFSTRTNPTGYNDGNGRIESLFGSTNRNVWENGAFNGPMNTSNLGSFLGTSGVTLGNNGANSGYGENSRFGLAQGGYRRNVGPGELRSSTFASNISGFDGSYEDLYRSGASVYGDSITWRSTTPELDGSSSFDYGIGNLASNSMFRSSEDYIGSYTIANRQSNRGIAA